METFTQPKITGYRQLTQEEAALMNEGKALAEPAATIAGGPALEVEDALEDVLAERHGIDGRALVAKLRGLTFAQEVALVDYVEQFWRAVTPDPTA